MEKCEMVFGDNTSPCSRGFKCLNLAIREGEDMHEYTAIVSRDTRNPKLTDRPSQSPSPSPSPSLRHSTLIPITLIVNRGADLVAAPTSLRIVLSLNISARTGIRAGTSKDSAIVVANADRIQSASTGEEAPMRINIAKRMAF